MDDLSANGEFVVLYVFVIKKPNVFDYSFFFEFYWDAEFVIVEDLFDAFYSCAFEF